MPVTNGDRVLIHLHSRVSIEGWDGGVSDQDLISSLCGIGRTHVPRVLKPLIQHDLVTEVTGRSPGKVRRVKVYSLTQKGSIAASEALARAEATIVKFTNDENVTLEQEASKVLSRINHRLTRLSMTSLPLSLLLSLPNDDMRWNDILWLAASMKNEYAGMIQLPDGWRATSFEGLRGRGMFRRDLIEKFGSVLGSHGMVLLKGRKGSATSELIQAYLDSSGRKALWLEKGENNGESIDTSSWDVVVLLNGGDPEVNSLLMGEVEVNDIRTDDWPLELKERDLILTTTADVDIGGPIIEVKGVLEDFFVDHLAGIGLPNTLSREIYEAFKGSAELLRMIDSMDEKEIESLLEMNVEDAVLSLMMSMDDTKSSQKSYK